MTHMGTSLHVHATVALPDGRRVLGHVDGLAVAAGATLRVGK
jgi:predicted DNA-binding protein with PD1-like motif